jgi:hypothetical protein
MESDNNSPQEKLYSLLNKTTSDVLRIIKYLIYPLSMIFILIVIFWGVDIIKLNNELSNIKESLDIKLDKIDVKQRETNLVADEKLVILKSKLEHIDSTFSKMEKEYEHALQISNTELKKLQSSSNNVSDYSMTIETALNNSLKDYEKAKNKYSTEIEYASKGAEQRKKDIEQMFQESKKLLLQLTDIIENTNNYIEENVKVAIVTEPYDESKIKLLSSQLKQQLKSIRKQLQKN